LFLIDFCLFFVSWSPKFELDKKELYAITDIFLLNSAAKLKNTGSRFVATLLLREIEGINIFVLPSVIETKSESIMSAVT
jgi:predicted butyrate kinase (DUF1464 family)